VTLEEKLAHCRALAAATRVPVSADLENGFADDPDGIARTIRLVAETGVVGGSIEDYSGERIYDFDHAVERVQAAVEAARSLDFPFTLTARAENLLRGRDDLDDTIRRLQAYSRAGADVLYAPGLSTLEQVREVCGAVDKPVNVLAAFFPQATAADLAEAGAKRISVGSALANVAIGALLAAGREMREQGGFGWLEQAAPGADIRALLGPRCARATPPPATAASAFPGDERLPAGIAAQRGEERRHPQRGDALGALQAGLVLHPCAALGQPAKRLVRGAAKRQCLGNPQRRSRIGLVAGGGDQALERRVRLGPAARGMLNHCQRRIAVEALRPALYRRESFRPAPRRFRRFRVARLEDQQVARVFFVLRPVGRVQVERRPLLLHGFREAAGGGGHAGPVGVVERGKRIERNRARVLLDCQVQPAEEAVAAGGDREHERIVRRECHGPAAVLAHLPLVGVVPVVVLGGANVCFREVGCVFERFLHRFPPRRAHLRRVECSLGDQDDVRSRESRPGGPVGAVERQRAAVVSLGQRRIPGRAALVEETRL